MSQFGGMPLKPFKDGENCVYTAGTLPANKEDDMKKKIIVLFAALGILAISSLSTSCSARAGGSGSGSISAGAGAGVSVR